MQFILNFLIWTADPDMFTIPLDWTGFLSDRPVRWYGLMFAGGFILSQQVMFWVFRKEGKPEKDIEKLTVYLLFGTVIGARLGHCIFYNPGYYFSHPIEILKVWEGGLASHGGTLGLLIGIYLFARKYKYPMLWMCDRLVIVVALTGAMIRTGNFFNSEMEGTLTHSKMGVVYARYTKDVLLKFDPSRVDAVTFEKGGKMESTESGLYPVTAKIIYRRGVQLNGLDKAAYENQLRRELNGYQEIVEHVDFGGNSQPLQYEFTEEDGHAVAKIYGIGKVRHAAQIYEAASCVVLMLLMLWIWEKKRFVLPQGFNFALFMILLWTERFVDEFFKMSQESFEDDMVINMGQILSIPMCLSGIIMLILFYKKQKVTMSGDQRRLS